MISPGYPAGCTQSTIDNYWGNTWRPSGVDEDLEMLQNECSAIRNRLDALEKKQCYRGLSEAEEGELDQLEAQLSENEDEIQRLNEIDWEDDARCQAADARLNDELGK